MLSLENQLLKQLQDRLQDDERTQAKFVSWKEKKRAIENLERQQATPDLLSVREELEKLEDEMGTDPKLSEMLDLAKGRAVTVAEMVQLLRPLPEELGRRIVLVDWFQIAPSLPYHLLILRIDGAPTLIQLDPNLNEKIIAWVGNYVGAEKPVEERKQWLDAFMDLQDLRALVQPLQDHTSPEDILVFSPTELLHRLPVHAIKVTVPDASSGKEKTEKQRKVKDQILLRRNSIFYTQSMSLFRLSVVSNAQPNKPTGREKIAIGSPLTLGESCVGAFEDILEFDRVSIDRLNRTRIITDWTGASFVYFFGHVHDMGKENRLNTHLLLAVDEEEATTAFSGIPRSRNAIDSQRHTGDPEIAGGSAYFYRIMRNRRPNHYDHPVASFNAIKASIWTELVVDEWEKTTESTSSHVDLGACVHRACLDMMEEFGEESLVDWAPYVYHGWPSLHFNDSKGEKLTTKELQTGTNVSA